MDCSVFWTHIWFLVSFSDSVHRRAFTERYEIYLRSTLMSVGKSVILGVRLPNVIFGFMWMEHFGPSKTLTQKLLVKVSGNKT